MAVGIGRSCSVDVDIAAPVESVWALVSDVTRNGEWSVESRGSVWLDGVSAPAAGARFRGRNRRNGARWSRICEVLEVEPPRRFVWRTLPTLLYPDSTRWELALEPHDGGTRLTETMQVLKMPALHDRVFAIVLPQHRDRRAELRADLARVQVAIEAG